MYEVCAGSQAGIDVKITQNTVLVTCTSTGTYRQLYKHDIINWYRRQDDTVYCKLYKYSLEMYSTSTEKHVIAKHISIFLSNLSNTFYDFLKPYRVGNVNLSIIFLREK
jgi:hypothetical protein